MRVFVSHNSKDRYFVGLLMELLDYHGVHAWYSGRDVSPGLKFRDQIDKWLRQAEVLLVVVSVRAKESKWMTKEIAMFQTLHGDGIVVPLCLDATDPNELIDQLHSYEAIDFAEDMRAGFKSLLAVFGKDFLPRVDHRRASRRSDARRSDTDRRRSSITQRLRLGFWKRYSEAVGISKFDELILSRSGLYRAITALTPEASRYRYAIDANHEITSKEALEASANEIWEEWRPREPVKAVYVIEAIAERLAESFHVVRIDRRRADRRGQATDRRDVAAAKAPRR